MTAREAVREDFRRVGVALLVAALISVFLQPAVPALLSVFSALVGMLLCGTAYWDYARGAEP